MMRVRRKRMSTIARAIKGCVYVLFLRVWCGCFFLLPENGCFFFLPESMMRVRRKRMSTMQAQ